MPPWGLTEIFRSKGSYFDCILQICPFVEPDQPQICAFFKLTHYRRLSWRPLSFPGLASSLAARGPVVLSNLAGATVSVIGARRRMGDGRRPR
jgi:hypothetical protein